MGAKGRWLGRAFGWQGLVGIWLLVSSAGGFEPCANPGVRYAWGDNELGQLGCGVVDTQTSPALVLDLDKVVSISSNVYHSLALLQNGYVQAWGYNYFGQLGDLTNKNRYAPVDTVWLAGVSAVRAGAYHSMALLANGTVKTWGLNLYGELGIPEAGILTIPTVVPGLSGVVAIETNSHTNYALLAGGTVVAWGNNQSGQIGDGTTTERWAPVGIPNLAGVKALSAGNSHVLALMESGSVMAWGDNTDGQLGISEGDYKFAPTLIPGLSGVVAVSAGAGFSLALMADGTVKSWGDNFGGCLGYDSDLIDDTSEPRPIPGLSNVAAISAGCYHCVALMTDGTVKTWGRNSYGQLGDGTITDEKRFTPTAVPGLTAVTAIEAGDRHTLVLLRGVKPFPYIYSAYSASAMEGLDFSYQIVASNGATAFSVSGLPSGLALNSVTGLISGVPAKAGVYAVKLKASNDVGSDERTLTLTVTEPERQVVSVSASDPDAAELGANSGVFTITRTGGSSTTITVGFNLSGTADSGDYNASPAVSVTLPAGSETATVVIVPVDDQVIEDPETVVLTLTAGTGYTLGSPVSATVTIADDDATHPATLLVTRFYEQCLQREPDAAGLNDWALSLRNGTATGADVANGFVMSDEFKARNLADGDFVDVQYRAFFGREPDAAGKTGWVGQLQAGETRRGVMNGFVRAAEFTALCGQYGINSGGAADPVEDFVCRLYGQCLGRAADGTGRDAWTSSLHSGAATGSGAASGFVFSPECLARNLDDGQFVDLLYAVLLDRTADAGGRAFWVAQLAAGMARPAVFARLAQSVEFSQLCAGYGIRP